jgi:hypothetical protein
MLYILEEKIAPFRVNDVALTSTALYTDDFEIDISGWSIGDADNGSATHVAPAASNNYNGGLKLMQTANATSVYVTDNAVAGLVAGKKYKVSWTVIDFSTAGSPGVANSEVVKYVVSLIVSGGATEISYEANDISNGSFDFTFIADDTSNYNLRLYINETQNDNNYITFGEVKVEEVDNATLANNVYRLGDVYVDNKIIPEVTAKQARQYDVSPLAKPTQSNPTYVKKSASSIEIHPGGITGNIAYDYVKTPADPYWGYVVVPSSSGGSEYPLYDSTTATHFELHESEEPTLVNRILEMSGVTMKQPDVVQYGSTKNNEEFQKENS